MGAGGERFIAAAIAISTFGFLNLAVLAPTRVYYAMAADGAFLPALAKLHPRYGTPGAAIILQSTWAVLLAMTGEYGDLLDTVVFADWIFFGLTVAGLFILRRRLGAAASRPMPGYPWLPVALRRRRGGRRLLDDPRGAAAVGGRRGPPARRYSRVLLVQGLVESPRRAAVAVMLQTFPRSVPSLGQNAPSRAD